MKVAFDTLGCKLNQAETDSLARRFAGAGHSLVSSVDEADIYILNTCTVTQVADAKSRHLLRLAHRRNVKAVLVATGCYAQRRPQELAEIEGIGLVADNDEKTGLLRLLEDYGYLDNQVSIQNGCADRYQSDSRTRAFVQIQDGCNSYCSYCIVPLVRGREKSLPAGEIISEIKQRVSEDNKEAVLTGTEIGTYDNSGIDLKELLERLLDETGISRLRLSSLQPREISPELIRLWSDTRLCRHFHLSLQSGSDRVLRRMKRQYSTDDYRAAVSLIRGRVPDAAITTDIIAGFPGETAAEFEESYEFCRQMGFARLHVFPYSPRPGTEAAMMTGQVPNAIKKQRNQKLLALARECATNFNLSFAGRTLDVLWEQRSDGLWSGHTGNYIKVYTKSDDNLSNRITPGKLVEARRDGMWGEIVKG